jgi:hypothetical protein
MAALQVRPGQSRVQLLLRAVMGGVASNAIEPKKAARRAAF